VLADARKPPCAGAIPSLLIVLPVIVTVDAGPTFIYQQF
jgi:hypothetical protein